MPDRQHRLWQIACVLLIGGLVGLIALMIIAEVTDPKIPGWLPAVSTVMGLVFGAGALIVWWHGIKFYARVHPELGIGRSGVYLLLVIGFGWLAPFIFIALEGRGRFFGYEK